ncbi:Uncharacterised protein [Staphylococcus intermedius NCTC 11048]|uniref:Uncharacterized protein n=1 Tax=Staphylococcus intermedius NCTC 11048 TaxID=1141106 RepID=A0A380G6S8_STAIN|nr:Uncharacterised protein [Staphylococcus intermedius NCTC 11048]
MNEITKIRIKTVLNYGIGIAALIFAAYILLK